MKLEPGMRALVTGASSGIGALLAERLAERGVTVGIVARRADRLAEVLDRCKVHAPDSRMWSVDLGDLAAAETLADTAWDELGPLDVVVHNAGIPKRRHVTDLVPAEIDEVLRVNFHSPVQMTLRLLPRMLERGKGSLVFVSSLAGRVGVPREAAYASSKFALCGWAEAMQVDLFDTPLEIRLLLPGAIDTEIWDQPGNDDPIYEGPKEPAGPVADGVVAAIESEKFEHYLPDMKAVVEFKTADIDGYLAGAADMARQAMAGEGFAWADAMGGDTPDGTAT
ncbi:MAG TPA: SDR family oxidoreductase [Acidimicrobiales bacterium]|jgi:short-subunit dehydrogenase|nr:SDR family oxidoreductase [Acidimicrobiales bacterium]